MYLHRDNNVVEDEDATWTYGLMLTRPKTIDR